MPVADNNPILCVADVPYDELDDLLARFGLTLRLLDDGEEITGTYWGAPEAGIQRSTVYVRRDTPVHSLLHETCHVICMSDERRRCIERDAGGSDLEESGVCFLQVVLADALPAVGAERLMRDMDNWGYSFRLGSTSRWFSEDADDARAWLLRHSLLDCDGNATFDLRRD